MAEVKQLYAGAVGLGGGMDSFTLPLTLPDNEVISAENCINRGGIYQTRPDSRSLFTCPCDSMAQGCILFTPANSIPYLVFASYGKIYVSPKPFKTYVQLPNIQFSFQSHQMAWAVCQQSTDYDAAGNLYYLDRPVPVLVMQDGNTRAAYWDGTTSRHLNPTRSGHPNSTPPGLDETVIGLWMTWSNNRLWVSRGNQIFSSDIGNPLKFTEAQYLNEGRAFYLPNECVGLCETPDRQGIIAFTGYEGVFIKSSVQDRTQWLSLADGVMQNTFLPNTGCASHRSIVNQYGLLWWFSPQGMINLNAAQRENLSSRLEISDNEMFDSKYYLGSSLDGICGVAHENFLLESVPSGDRLNRHTWVLDQNPASSSSKSLYTYSFSNAWASRWTGWRPVEWTTGLVDNRRRVFFQSYDYDGRVRIWEAFTGRTGCDNGVPITAWVWTKEHNFATAEGQPSMERKRFRWAEFSVREFLGNASLMVCYAGRKGSFVPVFNAELCASRGQVVYNQDYGEGYNGHPMAGNRPQTRRFRTQDAIPPTACNACGVESNEPNNIDTQFSLLFLWSGKLGIEWYRMVAMEEPPQEGGDAGCITEVCPNSLNEDGCSAKDQFVATMPLTTYASTQTVTITVAPYTYTSTQSASSFISQADADRMAMAKARSDCLSQAGYITQSS